MKYRLLLLAGTIIFGITAFVLTTDRFQSSPHQTLTDAELAERARQIASGMNSREGSGSGSTSGSAAGDRSTAGAMQPPVDTEPSADNVSTSYYERVKDLESFLATNPADTTHMLRLARLLHQGHQLQEATEWYSRLLEINPQQDQVRLDLINAYGQAGQWELALLATDELLEIRENHPGALYNKAAIYANMGRNNDAAAIWEALSEQEAGTTIGTMSKNALSKLAAM